VYQCASCGRENDSRSRRCVACGEPISPAAARAVTSVRHAPPSTALAGAAPRATPRGVVTRAAPVRGTQRVAPVVAPCRHCGRSSERTHPFCPYCGLRASYGPLVTACCTSCGANVRPDDQGFCASCGAPIAVPAADQRSWTAPAAHRFDGAPRLSLLAADGSVSSTWVVDREVLRVGRVAGDIRFEDDPMLADEHAELVVDGDALRVRETGGREASWVYIGQPRTLSDGDRLLVGSQLIRYRRLDAVAVTAFERPVLGSGSLIPNVDVGVLEQMRPDGTTRNTFYLSAGRSALIGREHGDWVFPYDPTMSPRHAEVRTSGTDVTVRDLASRTGVAIAVRGEATVRAGERLLMGTRVLRLERD
jgi:pSer/pThr/pTyr-binding forkhead associated (FHA) protein